MREVIKLIENKIHSKERMTIIYNGGSHPGAIREISPIEIIGEKLRARCYTSNTVKTFSVNKISTIGTTGEISKNYIPSFLNQKIFENLDELLSAKITTFEQQGWFVNNSDVHISLHRYSKKKTPLKTCDISISYVEDAFDLVMNLDGEINIENERKRVRPWVVRCSNIETKTYGKFEKAYNLFLELANNLAPINKENMPK